MTKTAKSKQKTIKKLLTALIQPLLYFCVPRTEIHKVKDENLFFFLRK